MNIWAKMMTALRGGVSEAGEAAVDSQALKILDQEVRDASEDLKQSKRSLAEIMAKQRIAVEKQSEFQNKIEEHEEYAIKALEQGDEVLALEVAEKIADFETQLEQIKDVDDSYTESVNSLRLAVKHTERNVKRLKQQVDTVKATENVHRAQAAVAQRYSGSPNKMRTAMDSLERIKERQAINAAKIAAKNELADDSSGDALKAKLEKAGIVSGAHNAGDVLKRIKSKKSSEKK